MDDSDIFSDEPRVTQARAGAKFQPRGKLNPRKERVTSVPCDKKEESVKPSLSSLDNGLTSPRGLFVDTSTTFGTEVSMRKSFEDLSQIVVTSKDDVGFIDAPSSDVLVSVNDRDGHSVPNIWAKEVDFDLDPFDDVANQVTTNGRAGGKFQPKIKPKGKEETSSLIPSELPNVLKEEAATVASMGSNAACVVDPDGIVDDCRSLQVMNPSSQVAVTDSEVAVSSGCDDSHSNFGRSVGETADIFSGLECLDQFLTQSSNNDGVIQIDDERTTQEARAFPDVDTEDIMSSATIASRRHAGKFKPETRSQASVVTSQPAVLDSIMHPPNSQFVPSETMCVESSIPDFPSDDVPECSSADLGAFIPPDPSTSEFAANEELTNLTEASDPGVTLSAPDPDMHGKLSSNIRKRKAAPIPNPSEKSNQSSVGDGGNENGKATKWVTSPKLDDDHGDGTSNDDGPATEPPTSSAMDEDKYDDDEYNVESAFPTRRTSRRSKKPMAENEKSPRKRDTANKKQAQKRKKANEASDQPTKERPQKFSHSTRRKRRFVDESLLHTPEDEIDFANVALKDIILLADYKERIQKKEAKTSKIPLTNQSPRNTFPEENAHNEENSIASEQDLGDTDDQVSGGAQSSSFCLNYQSYMDKEPRARWTKQDTELFYGAIRQFGPDFSMIQQLFPGRSRHQIKLKFKNEERRYPLRLSEALASRPKDHSYFEKVIEQLQQVAGQAEQESNGDVSIDLTHEEAELTPETNGEAMKSEQDEDLAVGNQEADVAEDHSALKSDESDDDHGILSSYRSAF